ncbi:flagellar basal-body rod protein FlgB [Paenibacillus chitinolyticus]|uniref:flagellar basal body rod protein FlgB n=1 Tax=Paenibacillus chitinolyticus TaxID=79263 RepID=UPI0026E4A9D5|nr:flagellar basal body rod protein FlgB [Paenibacillus chitinolyticus]GKS10032.1 flagellar basal-body rod protein FlgB [Paenibacillus chitinolyticus]
MFLLNQAGFQWMEKSLDASALRQRVISNNVANADTPHFKRSDVLFEELLQEKMTGNQPVLEGRRTNSRHLPIPSNTNLPGQAVVESDPNSLMNNNLNNVDMDYEMSLMAKNQLKYNTMVQEMNNEFRKLKIAMDGRR